MSALVGFPNWHVSGLGCGNLERVGWGTWLVSPCEAHHTRQDEAEAVSLTSVNVWIAWNTYFLIIAKANSKFGNLFIFLYHCIFGQSFYTVQWAVHPTYCDIVYQQTATWLEKNKSNFKFSEACSLVGFGWLVVGFAIKPIFSPSPPPLMTTIATNL